MSNSIKSIGLASFLGVLTPGLLSAAMYDSPLSSSPPVMLQQQLNGAIVNMDPVIEKIWVRGPNGNVQEFLVDTNTPITDHNIQISFSDLRVGNQVVVYYNAQPLSINRIERF